MPDIPGMSEELWDTIPPAVQAIIVALHTVNLQLREELRDLQARLGQDSSTSHKPPSSDPWWKNANKKKVKSGKKPGGQPGHTGHHRPIVPIEQVDEVLQYFPEQCEHCGDALNAEGNMPDEPERHQVSELPAVKAKVTEHQLHRRRCKSCRKISKAKISASIAGSAFGPRMQAEIVHLIGNCKLPRRGMVQYAAESWGTNISLGSIQAVEKKVSDALEQPYTEALVVVQQAQVRYIDETGWPQKNLKGWLWTAVCALATVFMIAPTRGSVELKAFLGDALLFGYIVTDRCKSYNPVEMIRRGICHAHLKRDFFKISALGGPNSTLGHALSFLHRQVFILWGRFKSGEIERAVFDAELAPLRKSMQDSLEQGSKGGHKKIAGMCTDILRHWPAVWNFTLVEGMEPTNNAAERAHRQAVKWRKMSFGTRSANGSRFVERMLTVAETCRQNGRNVLDFLVRAITAATLNQPAPPLIALPSPS
jgi:transposase